MSKATTGGDAAPKSEHSPQEYRKNFSALKTTREFRWYVGHVAVVVFSTLFLFVRFLSSATYPTYIYRAAFFSALIAFIFVVSPKYGTAQVPFSVVARDQDFQYLYLSLVWIFSTERYLAPIPFLIYSIFHALTYTRSFLLPALHAKPNERLLHTIDTAVKRLQEPLTALAAHVELLLLLRIILAALRLRRGSGIQLIAYFVFYRYRYAVSKVSRDVVHSWEVRIDNVLPVGTGKDIWLSIKERLASIPGPQVQPTE